MRNKVVLCLSILLMACSNGSRGTTFHLVENELNGPVSSVTTHFVSAADNHTEETQDNYNEQGELTSSKQVLDLDGEIIEFVTSYAYQYDDNGILLKRTEFQTDKDNIYTNVTEFTYPDSDTVLGEMKSIDDEVSGTTTMMLSNGRVIRTEQSITRDKYVNFYTREIKDSSDGKQRIEELTTRVVEQGDDTNSEMKPEEIMNDEIKMIYNFTKFDSRNNWIEAEVIDERAEESRTVKVTRFIEYH